MRSVIVYSVLRILAFAVPFGILLLFPVFQQLPWLAAVFAAVIGLALSLLLLRPRLDAVSTDLDARRARRTARTDAERDADVENAANDAARADAARTDAAGPADPTDARAAAADVETRLAPDPGSQPTNAQKSTPA